MQAHGKSYFAEHTVRIQPREQQDFTVYVASLRRPYSFDIALDLTVGGRTGVQLLRNGDVPWRFALCDPFAAQAPHAWAARRRREVRDGRGALGRGRRYFSPRLWRVIVRSAGAADVAALAELRGIEPDNLPWYADWVAAHAQTHLPFVAEVDGQVVGVAWLHLAERVPANNEPDRRYGDVQSVEVREAYRNRGIGGALMSAILAEARARGLLHVTVHSGRRAVDFYLRNDFTHHRQLLLWQPDQPPTPSGA